MTKYEWIEELSRYTQDKYNITVIMSKDEEDEDDDVVIEVIYRGRALNYDYINAHVEFEEFKKEVYKLINEVISSLKL